MKEEAEKAEKGFSKKEMAGWTGLDYIHVLRIEREAPEDGKLFRPMPGGGFDPAFFVQQWAKQREGQKRPAPMQMTQKDLSEVSGRSRYSLIQINNNLEEADKLFVESPEGGFELPTFVQRWVKYNVASALEGLRSLDQVKAAHEIIKKRKTELEVEKMEGGLIDVQDVRRVWGDIANAILQGMLHLPAQLAPMLQGMESVEAIGDILDQEIRKVLDGISETPLPRYMILKQEEEAPEAEEDEEEEGENEDG